MSLEEIKARQRTSTCMGATPSTPEQAKAAAGQLIGVDVPKLVAALEAVLSVTDELSEVYGNRYIHQDLIKRAIAEALA